VDRRRSAYFASVAEHRLLGLDQRLTEDKGASRDRERQPIAPGVAS